MLTQSWRAFSEGDRSFLKREWRGYGFEAAFQFHEILIGGDLRVRRQIINVIDDGEPEPLFPEDLFPMGAWLCGEGAV